MRLDYLQQRAIESVRMHRRARRILTKPIKHNTLENGVRHVNIRKRLCYVAWLFFCAEHT